MRGIRDGRSLGVGYADAVKEMRTLENPIEMPVRLTRRRGRRLNLIPKMFLVRVAGKIYNPPPKAHEKASWQRGNDRDWSTRANLQKDPRPRSTYTSNNAST